MTRLMLSSTNLDFGRLTLSPGRTSTQHWFGPSTQTFGMKVTFSTQGFKNTMIDLTMERVGCIVRLPYQGITELVRHPTVHPTIHSATPESRLLIYIITRILKSRHGTHTTIFSKDLKVIHTIMHMAPINWAKLVMLYMADAATITNDRILPYAFLIMEILEWAQVAVSHGPLTRATKLWTIHDQTFKKSQNSCKFSLLSLVDIAGGQRKRSRTGKNVASSSAPAPPPAHKYLDGSFLWFNDRAETTRFSEKFEHREILPPWFSTARFIHDSIPREARVILERGNFIDLLYIKKAHYQPFLVRAFYSNLKKDEDGALISNVNGVDIYLNEENIQILTGLRQNGEDLGLYVGEGGARFNETALLEEVGIRNFAPTPQQRSPTITSMNPVFRFIFYVLTRILKPWKYNHTALSQKDTKTLHAMIHNANINWCKFVMTHMFSATSDDRSLPCAILIMAILDEYNIKTDVGPKIKGTKHWEIDESSFHSGTDETPFRQPRPRRQPRDTSSNTPSLAEQMAALTATTNVSQTAQNVNILSRELHGYFDFVNYPYAQMVPYAPPPNLGGEPSGTNNVGREEEVNNEEEEEEEAEEEEEDDDDDDDDEEEDIDEEQLLDDLSPDF
ncbi:unnamed protein product [Cuscuta campestris]|uniref:Uncharacterized protein n=1 Tax=Cuscuta campestris TaxID=132261 RepID=A0A484LV00_9ASTE|nr:unnamed protein product [Cuscuta campestris]